MLIRKVFGKEVLNAAGNIVGRVSDMDIDLVTGNIKSIFLRSGLAQTTKIKTADIFTVGDRIIIQQQKPTKAGAETYNCLGIKRIMLSSC